MALSFLKVYFDFEERTEMLSEVEQGRLLLTMLRYAQGKTLPELKGNEKYLFPVFKGDIDRDRAAYVTKVENGTKGGRPAISKTEKNLTKPNETEDNRILKNKNKNKNKTEEQEQEQEQEREGVAAHVVRFTPPTVDEVSAYASEKGYTGFNAQRFVDFYESKGWMVGKNKMKNWHAAVGGWASRDSEQQTQAVKTNPAMDYAQREYKAEDYGDDFFFDVISEYGDRK